MSLQLKDVAAYTGVSVQTVSNVVNGNYARVGAKTRTKVLAALEELNYHPNMAARHLRKARIGVVALAIPELSNPYFADIGDAIVAAAKMHSYTVLLDYTGGERENESLVINGLRPHLIDGAILDPQALEMEDIQPNRVGIPIVLLGERLFGAPCDHVVIDNVAAAHLATTHLLTTGRRRIAAIGVRDESQCETPSLRLQGFEQAMQEAGQEIDPHLLIAGGGWHRSDGVQAMRHLLALDTPPDAIFCFNDLLALGAMSVLHEVGRRIPEDIAVVGFDDIEDGRYATPALTTIAPDKEEIGRLAISLLIERIQGIRTGHPERVDAPFSLHIRTSTVPSNT